ncbi:sensor domain-containing diguanylate cyclase [Ammoniphilus resinae]|nr:diguanylate cyclase [Ammoniphilus resinae]
MNQNVILNLKLGLIITIAIMLAGFSSSPNDQNGSQQAIPLGQHYEVFKDPTGSATITSILSGKYDDQFLPSESKYLFFGYTNDTIWLKLELQKVASEPNSAYWIENIDKLSQIEAYLVNKDGSYTIEKRGVDYLANQPIPYRSFLFHITDPSTHLVYFKLSGNLPITFMSYLHTEQGFIQNSMQYKFWSGIFYGFMASLMLYNLFLFFSIKEKMYLYYVFYIVSFLFYQAAMNTMDLEYLGKWVPAWILERSIPLVYHLLNFCMILFGKEFLTTKQNLPRMNTMLSILSGLSILFFVLVFVLPESYFVDLMAFVLGIVSPICLWIAGLLTMSKGNKAARLYLAGWSILLICITAQVLCLTAVLPFHPSFFEMIPAAAAAMEAILLSLALADKINSLKRQREEEQNLLNQRLERLVSERTKNLEKANARLIKLSTTDFLTQIPNRYQMENYLRVKMQIAEQHATPLSVILMDIDDFKLVNDHYGHDVGDQVLKSVAKIIKHTIRDTDLAGRWGGEEFLIICPNTSLHEAFIVANTLREAIEAHSFPLDQKKTGSFGVATFHKGDQTSQLVIRVDQALYRAKENGRNRVECGVPLAECRPCNWGTLPV